MWKRSIESTLLKRGRLALLMLGIWVMGSLALAAPSALRITIGTFAPYYSPTFVHVGMTPISWDNPTGALHSITHDECQTGGGCAFDSGPLGPNGIFTVHHLPPGSYPYHCSFHPIMLGALVVAEPDLSRET